MGCCHRDVKPENVCIKSDDVTDVRLCDFEQARPLLKHGHVYTKEESKDSSRGSLDYMAPERFYGIAAGAEGDCWSLGVLAYTLLRAQLPFDACLSPLQRRHPILKADVWDGLSEPAISLISSLLNVDAGQRLDLQGVFAHEWLSANRVETLSPFSSVQPPCSVQAQIDQAHSQACRLAQLAQLNTGDEEMTMSCSAWAFRSRQRAPTITNHQITKTQTNWQSQPTITDHQITQTQTNRQRAPTELAKSTN